MYTTNSFLYIQVLPTYWRHKDGLDGQWRAKRAQTTCWVCHLGPRYVFSFFFLHFFCVLTKDYFYRFYLCFEDTRWVWLGNDGQNRPKRRTWYVVWAIGTHFFFPFVFLYTNKCFFITYRFYIHFEGTGRVGVSGGNNSQAQTMPDALFGP